MRILKFLLLAAAILTFVAPASSATTATVTIKRTGFSPGKTTINSGDSVKWVNTDTVDRQVVATGGQFVSPVIKPGASWTHRFDVAGTYKYRDALKPAQNGSVVVNGPPPSVSIFASAPIISYGDTVTLSGRISNGKTGEQVTVYGKPYGQASYIQLAVVLTGDTGVWSYAVKPELLTSYQAQWNKLNSAEIQTAVAPKLVLKRVGAWFVARIQASHSFKNHWIYVQRRSSLGQWVNVKKVIFGTADAQRFKVKVLPKGLSRLRIFMTVNQAGVGYLAAQSSTLLVRR